MGWAKFWAIFSQTHPVTLVASDEYFYKLSMKKLLFWEQQVF
jgi:hypothetical protein